ncbi:MAG: DUF2779 domain-containing protein [Propionibacteriaceae bacterium]|jgi:hypothetical protein|nr:DUF2779 domain-containing protein [Propionibacteriaceae bacterium]
MLTKSKYTRGIQCPKMLWLYDHHPELAAPQNNEVAAITGNLVGELARGYFGGYVEVPFDPDDFGTMTAQTKRLIDAATPVIAEASFAYLGSFCRVDILRVGDDGVHIVEVKSSAPSGAHLRDLAYQCWVVEHCGLKVISASLMHLDKQYVRRGDLDLHRLFTVKDLSREVRALQEQVGLSISMLKETAAQADEPQCKIGLRCFEPYECVYRAHCWALVPKPNVFDLDGIGAKKGCDLMGMGIITLEDALTSGKLNAKQERQALAELNDTAPHIDADAIRAFLDTLSYPLYFLDFETFNPAIPQFDGAKPYQQIPSQYSLHYIEREDAPLQHMEFLAEAGSDPRRALAERICADIPANACVMAYNMSFEKRVLKGLAESFPDLARHLLVIRANVRDLMVPFKNGDYQTKEMHGSYSIKAVLPALFPGDPELDYNALEGVRNGTEAMNAYAGLPNRTPDEIAAIRRQLLEYCKLDTLAMVKIWEKLCEVVS